MVICVLAGGLAAAAAPGSGAARPAGSSTTAVHVRPATGGIHTTFRLRFAIPAATGTSGSVRRTDSLVVSGPARKGCDGASEVTLGAAPAHHTFHIALAPNAAGGHWCTGTFHGRLMETLSPVCPPPVSTRGSVMCPLYAVAPKVLARFRFKVTRTGT